jgi:hypothetical protein
MFRESAMAFWKPRPLGVKSVRYRPLRIISEHTFDPQSMARENFLTSAFPADQHPRSRDPPTTPKNL